MEQNEFRIEGRNAVIEAFRSGKPLDKIFILDGCQDGPIMTIKREAKKQDTLVMTLKIFFFVFTKVLSLMLKRQSEELFILMKLIKLLVSLKIQVLQEMLVERAYNKNY